MNFQQKFSAALLGTVFLLRQPTKALALNARDISTIARDITVKVIQAETGNNGSGVIIDRQENTYSVLTNFHVAGEQGVYRVQTPDGTKYDVESKQELPGLDLMVLTFESSQEYTLAEIGNSDEVVPLQTIFVAGFPAIQNDLDLVSGQVRSIREDVMINPEEAQGYALVYSNQTLPGSSGGAVVDEDGQLVAINGESQIDPTTGRDISRGIPINIFLAASQELSQKTELAEAEQERVAEEKRLAAEEARQRAVELEAQQLAEEEAAEAEQERLAEEAAKEQERVVAEEAEVEAEEPVEDVTEPSDNEGEDNGDLALNVPNQYLIAADLEAHKDLEFKYRGVDSNLNWS